VAITVVVTLFLVYAGTKFFGATPMGRDARQPDARPATQARKGGTGELSGDVFVTMQSGDVKRGAGIQILLITATEQFESEWTKLVGQFKSEYGRASADLQQADKVESQAAKHSLDAIRNSADKDFERWMQKMKEADEVHKNTQNKVFAAANRVDQVRARYQAAAQKMIAEMQPRLARTDVNGHYSFMDVPGGRYRVFAEYRVFEKRLHWIVPAEVNSGATQRVDLSNSNAGWPF
jgi:hypothetical protein